MVDNLKSIKQRGEGGGEAMEGLRSRFLFNEGSPAQKLYYDKKQKAISFTKESNKKNSTAAEEEN